MSRDLCTVLDTLDLGATHRATVVRFASYFFVLHGERRRSLPSHRVHGPYDSYGEAFALARGMQLGAAEAPAWAVAP